MRANRRLRRLADARRQVRRMNEMDRVVRQVVKPEPGKPDTFFATSGESSTERVGDRWMPHDHRPIVGFAPNPTSHSDGS